MSTEIKNTLFRFVTMRAPELSDEKGIDLRFIYRGNLKGPFDTAVGGRTAGKSKWVAMQEVTANTTLFSAKNEQHFKTNYPSLYALAVWITRNRYSYTNTELLAKIATVPQNIVVDQELLWNNLIYQVITQKDFYTKEILMQMIVALHLVKNASNDPEVLKILMTSKVVLPKELFVEDAQSGSGPGQLRMAARDGHDDEPVMSLPTPEMQRVLTLSDANNNIACLAQLKKEMQKVEKAYRKDYDKAYEEAFAKYEDRVSPIMQEYYAAVEASKTEWCSIRPKDLEYNENDPCHQPKAVDKPKIPEFEFQFRDEIDLEYLETVLSQVSFKTLLEVLEIETDEETEGEERRLLARIIPSLSSDTGGSSYSSVFAGIDDNVSTYTQTIIQNTPGQSTPTVSVGGVSVPTTSAAPSVIPFSYQACPKTYSSIPNGGQSYVDITVKFDVPDASWQIASVETKVTKQNGGTPVIRTIYTQNRVGNSITLTGLHRDALSIGDFYYVMDDFIFTVTFSNGAKKSFTADFWHTLNCATGRMLEVVAPIEEPGTIPSTPVTGSEGTFIPSGFGVKQLGIADYKKVEQTVQGYVEGEVAAIENIMAREYKEKATRKLRRSENTTTFTSESEKEQLSDTTNTSRFEMQTEIAKVLQESKDLSMGGNFGAKYTMPNTELTIGANMNLATHSSKEESTRQAVTQAKEVTERAMERIVTKVKQERIEKIIEEFEENNKHGFDNTKGDKHVVGVYRWVDKVFKNQILNYGKRLMFEFMIPEPSKLHILGMKEDPMGTLLTPPDDPRTFVDPQGTSSIAALNLKDYTKISDATIKYWAGKFNVELPTKQEEFITCGASFNLSHDGTSLGRHEGAAGSGKIDIPDGYATTTGYVAFTAGKDSDHQIYSGMHVSLGNVNKVYSGNLDGIERTFEFGLTGYVKSVPVSYTMANFFHGNVNASVKCQLTPEAKLKWQQDTFNAIIEGYEDALVQYEQKAAEEAAKGNVIKEANPGFYRQIENMVLRKNCISYLIDQNPSAKRTYGKDMNKALPLGAERSFINHEVRVDSSLDDYSAFVKFIEQAFEWDIMSYIFYPYFWGNRQDWGQLYQYDNNDPLFRSFMQAGMARVILTVRPGFEEAVSYYLQTGQIWNGGEVPVIDDKLFLSIVDELRQPAGVKEGKAWATRIPTSLTILQADSIGLKVTRALPYDEDLSDFENPETVPHSTNFEISTSPMNASGAKTVEFTYAKMDGDSALTVGSLDSNNGFPKTFTCLNEEIVIERDAAWNANDSVEVVYRQLADQLSLIQGISATQVTIDGNGAGIRFIVDTEKVDKFTFEKSNPGLATDQAFDLVKIYFTSDSARVVSPTEYTDRLHDAHGIALTGSEINTLLPISRFAI